ncbi:Arf guanine nucleotide exchange factor SYT1 [Verticillium dahliae VDG1]|nr:Arf guanine nucleotide exchange factor SYT1 [Verticillium dahliae VDG1]
MPPPNLALRQIPSSLLDQLSLPHPAGTGPSDSTPILPRQNSDPEIIPAAVAGITLGAVAGFLLLVYVLYMCANGVGPSADYRSSTYGASTLSVRRRSRSRAHRHQSRGPSRARVVATERVRVRESGVGAPFVVDAEPVPMRERTRSVSRAPPPPRVVDDEDDEVVVIEEHTPPRRSRRHSRRGSGAYDDRRRSRDY